MIKKTKLEQRLIWIFALLGIASAVLRGIFSYTVDSELWSVATARYLTDAGNQLYFLYYKLVFHGLLNLPYHFPLSNVGHIYVSKGIFAVNFLVLCGLCFLIFRDLTG